MPPGSVLALKPQPWPSPVPKAVPVPPTPLNDNFPGTVPEWAKKAPKPDKMFRALLGRAFGVYATGKLLQEQYHEFVHQLGVDPIEFFTGAYAFNMQPHSVWTVTRCAAYGDGLRCNENNSVGCGNTSPASFPGLCNLNLQNKGYSNMRGLSTSVKQFRIWGQNIVAGVVRVQEYWVKPDFSSKPYLKTPPKGNPDILTDPFPQVNPVGDPVSPFQPGTSPLPNILPEIAPAGVPSPQPAPLPYAVPRPVEIPGFEPGYQPLKSPRPSKAPRPGVSPSPGVEVLPAPGGHVTVNIAAGAGGKGVPPTRAPRGRYRGNSRLKGQHQWKKPGKDEAEEKGKGGHAAAAAVAYGAATETNDFIDALWKAMGKGGGWQTKVKGQKTNPAEKVSDLFHAIKDPKFNHLAFWYHLPSEIAKMQAQDAAIGAVGSFGQKASKTGYRGNVGYGFGGALTGGKGPRGEGETYDHSQDLPTAGWLG